VENSALCGGGAQKRKAPPVFAGGAIDDFK
jgi:hypothetical protein